MSIPANIHVAIVDDDESLCRSLGRLLRVSGMQSISYSSAEAFLADSKHLLFDCLVLDVQLLGMSGIELQRKLSLDLDTTPIVFITALEDAEAQQQATEIGCAGYFRKSDPGFDIIAAIRRAVA